MGRDLESFGKPILIVGDPYQLKPVYGDGYYDLSNPDVPLTKIYRQHEGSGILALATAIREGRKISRAELGPDVSIIKKSRLKPKQTLRGLSPKECWRRRRAVCRRSPAPRNNSTSLPDRAYCALTMTLPEKGHR
jgi:hypothetical protein